MIGDDSAGRARRSRSVSLIRRVPEDALPRSPAVPGCRVGQEESRQRLYEVWVVEKRADV